MQVGLMLAVALKIHVQSHLLVSSIHDSHPAMEAKVDCSLGKPLTLMSPKETREVVCTLCSLIRIII